jgi:fucose 4-O-acetylase-like acetyltransferase
VVLGLRHILVPYVIWSAVFYLVVYLLQGEQYTVFEYAKNLAVGYPYHFVPLLVFFYLIAPLIVRGSPSLARRAGVRCLSAVLIGSAQAGSCRFAGCRLSADVAGIAVQHCHLWAVLSSGCGLRPTLERITALLERVRWPLAALAAAAYGLAVASELGLVRPSRHWPFPSS